MTTWSRSVATMVALAALAGAGKGRPRGEATNPAPAPVQAEKLKGDLFPKALPFDPGVVPAGLFGASAQVCDACHPTVVKSWSQSPHRRGPSAELLDAATGMPACLGCHLPLSSQADGQAGFDPTLQIEAVTCAACHLRGGKVVTATEAAAARAAPHGMVWSADLAGSDGCAACHQLSWPGASEPLYDTFGEWKRSGFAEIGLTCEGCHLGGAADGGPTDHAMVADVERALTVELKLPSAHVVRGRPALPGAIVLTNTGAGHSLPTGSPFRGIRLEVDLTDPDGVDLPPLLQADLARVIDPGPPFAVRADTRLGAGESRRFELPLALPTDAPAGDWELRLTLVRTVRGKVQREPVLDRRWHLVVE